MNTADPSPVAHLPAMFLPQVARLTRDLEGMLEQRDRAREEATRAEQARIQLEAEIKVGDFGPAGVGLVCCTDEGDGRTPALGLTTACLPACLLH
jgi:hypothetical protein